MISRVNIKTLIGQWLTLKAKNDMMMEVWFTQRMSSSYRNGTFSTQNSD